MSPNLKLVISDPDPDYNGIDIVGTNDEFAGSAFVYFGLGELQKFSEGLSRFPFKFRDTREFEFLALLVVKRSSALFPSDFVARRSQFSISSILAPTHTNSPIFLVE